MKKVLLFLLLLLPFNVLALELPNVNSSVVLVYDLNEDKELFNKGGSEKREIASLTKMITIYTALEYEKDLNKEITITDQMRWAVNPELSIHKIQTGEKYTVDELLHMCMLESAADACMAVAFDIKGSEAEMAKLVNDKAQEMCMSNSNFINITGLDDSNNYSSAEDLLIFLKQALKNDKFREIFTNKKYDLRNGTSVYPTINMLSQMLNLDMSKILGDKTGFTDPAGLCLASLIQIEDHEMIMITLGAPPVLKEGYHIKDADTLLRFLEDNYNYEILYNKDSVIKTLDIELSKTDKYDIKVSEDVKRFLPKDYDTSLVSYKYEGKEVLSYLDKKDSKVGTIKYFYDNELLYEQDVIVDTDIELSIPKVLNKYKVHLIIGFILIILLFIMIKLNHRKGKVRKHGKKS